MSLQTQRGRCATAAHLSVRSLNPAAGLFLLRGKSGGTGPGSWGHVGRNAACVASPTAAARRLCRQQRGQLANGTGSRQTEGKKRQAMRPVFTAPTPACRVAGADWLLLVFIGAY